MSMCSRSIICYTQATPIYSDSVLIKICVYDTTTH